MYNQNNNYEKNNNKGISKNNRRKIKMSGNNLNNNISNNESINLERSIQYSEHRANLDKAMNDHMKSLEKIASSKENIQMTTGVIAEKYIAERYLDELCNNENAECEEYQIRSESTKTAVQESGVIARNTDTEIKYQIKTSGLLKPNTEAVEKKYLGDKKIVSEENLEEVKSVDSKEQNTDTKDNKDTAENTYGRLSSKDGKVNSEKLNRNENEELTRRLRNGEKLEAENKDAKFRAQYLNQLSKAALCGALFSGISAASKEQAKDDIE